MGTLHLTMARQVVSRPLRPLIVTPASSPRPYPPPAHSLHVVDYATPPPPASVPPLPGLYTVGPCTSSTSVAAAAVGRAALITPLPRVPRSLWLCNRLSSGCASTDQAPIPSTPPPPRAAEALPVPPPLAAAAAAATAATAVVEVEGPGVGATHWRRCCRGSCEYELGAQLLNAELRTAVGPTRAVGQTSGSDGKRCGVFLRQGLEQEAGTAAPGRDPHHRRPHSFDSEREATFEDMDGQSQTSSVTR